MHTMMTDENNRETPDECPECGLQFEAINETDRLVAKAAVLLRRWRAIYGDLGFPDHEDGCLFSESGMLAGSIDDLLGTESSLSQDDYKTDCSLSPKEFGYVEKPPRRLGKRDPHSWKSRNG